MKRWLAVIAIVCFSGSLVGAKGCSSRDCAKLRDAVATACATEGPTCEAARQALALGCPAPVNPPSPPPESTPSPVCTGQSHGCWHRPPGLPWVYACPVYDSTGKVVGVQNEVDPAKCPLPPTSPPDQCILRGEPSTKADVQNNTLGDQVNVAMHQLRPDCEVGGTCLLGDMTQQTWQRLVEERLRANGLCAGQHTPTTDEIAASIKSDDPWQGFNVFSGDDSEGPVPAGQPRRTVIWSPEAYAGSWMPPGAAAPPTPAPGPATPPPAGDGCGEPAPPPAARFKVEVHNAFCANLDSTGLVEGADYCAAIGFTDGRRACPVRREGAADREACERRVFGVPVWSAESPTVEVFPCAVPGNCSCAGTTNTNAFQAIYIGRGTVKVCDRTGAACGTVVVP